VDAEGKYSDTILSVVCTTPGVVCNRKRPLIFSLPFKGPDSELIGTFEVELGEEPVDALYKFFSRHSLFSKEWDFQAVVKQVCNHPSIICRRTTAVKFFAEDFTMGGINIGPLVVWENEEVIDALFAKRILFNLTEEDQMKSFGEICYSVNVFCARTKAVVFKLSHLTTRDYQKFGNETCARKYAGWQYLESVTKSFMGSKMTALVKQKSVEQVSTYCYC